MMLGATSYENSGFPPERGGEHNWHVWCTSGALRVLKDQEYLTWLEENPDGAYTINFANNSSAKIRPNDPLWQALREIAKTHNVETFPLSLFAAKYLPWDNDANYVAFDAIKITKKPVI